VTLAAEAVSRSVPLIVAVGGDGTVNEVVNGATGEDGRPRVALGVVMTGRGRDACRNLGLLRDPLAAARRLVEGHDVRLDLGLARWPGGRRFFVNAAGAGFDAMVAARAARLGGGGTAPYLLAVLHALRAYRPVEITVESGGDPWWGPAAGVVVANGAHFGGGMRIAPGADPGDGMLDLVLLGAFGRAELVAWLPTIYWGGHLRNRKVRRARVERARIESAALLPVELDGEVCGETPLDVSVCPGALRLRV
jgi:YegS/Rv2252/BmrU family lipid kinase